MAKVFGEHDERTVTEQAEIALLRELFAERTAPGSLREIPEMVRVATALKWYDRKCAELAAAKAKLAAAPTCACGDSFTSAAQCLGCLGRDK